MSIDNLSDNEIRRTEAEIKARQNQVKPNFQHYGSVENLSDNEIRNMEAEIKARQNQAKPDFQHYGSVENLSDNEIKSMEAQIAEKRKQDITYQEYLTNLIITPNIADNQQFDNAIIRSMQSNSIMRAFTSDLVAEISQAIYQFKNIEKTDIENIKKQKQKIENLIDVYVKYLYGLKKHEWTFYGVGNNIGLEMISSDMLSELWQIEKNFNITFYMSIPKDLGEYYGQAFERKGKMIPAITLMYDDLKKQEVNWHQVLIYKENELTPCQRYMQRKEEAVNQSARQEELKNTLAYSYAQIQPDTNLVSNIENSEQVNTTTSLRR